MALEDRKERRVLRLDWKGLFGGKLSVAVQFSRRKVGTSAESVMGKLRKMSKTERRMSLKEELVMVMVLFLLFEKAMVWEANVE